VEKKDPPDAVFCNRDRSVFRDGGKPRPQYRDRLKAERWIQQYGACEASLKARSATSQALVQAAAGQSDAGTSKAAAESLNSVQKDLSNAEMDRHAAYGVVQSELRRELDYALWDYEAHLGWSVLGGAGGSLAQGPTVQYAIREHVPPGLKFTLSAGLERTSNLTWSATQPLYSNVTVRDASAQWTFPLIGTASFGWIHSWFLVGAGAAWTPEQHQLALVGKVGVAILENWLGTSDVDPNCGSASAAGGEGELRFVVEPWIPVGQPSAGPVSVLFGVEISAGVGWIRSAKCPYED
jgi:hypothetical protein